MRPLLLLAAVAIAYANSFSAALLFDSGALTIDDPRVHAMTTENVARILTSNYWGDRFASGLYRPVTTLTYMANYAANGETRTGYHVVNFLLHAVAVLLAYGVACVVMGAAWPAFFTALLWAVHPLGTEAVTNVAGRPDLLAAVAVFGGFLVYQGLSRQQDQIGKLIRMLALFAVSILGVFSKESAVVLLGMVLLYDWHCGRRPHAAGIAAIAVPALLAGVIHACLPMARPFVDNPLVAAGWLTSRMMALRVAARLIALWFWPSTLSADYSYNAVPVEAGVPLVVAVVGALLVVEFQRVATFFIFADRGVRDMPELRWLRAPASFWILLAFGGMLPTSNLLVASGSIMAERFMYLPGFALAALLVMGVHACLRNQRLATVALSLVAVAFCARTVARNEDYRDDLTFWKATVAAVPGSFKAQSQLAAEYYSAGRVAEAVEHISEATRILDRVPDRDNVMLSWTQAHSYFDAAGDTVRARAAADRVARIMNATQVAGGRK